MQKFALYLSHDERLLSVPMENLSSLPNDIIILGENLSCQENLSLHCDMLIEEYTARNYYEHQVNMGWIKSR